MSTDPLTVNGEDHQVDEDSLALPLADYLRNTLRLTAVHLGCRNGDCGACTVLMDDAAYKSCIVPTGQARGRTVETLHDLATDGELDPVQDSFWRNNAFQCGFCLSGHVLCTVAVRRADPEATVTDLREGLAGNLCRCTGYTQIDKAVTDLDP